MKVKFFTAGGTIDKVYFDAKSEYEVGPPQVVEILIAMNGRIFDPARTRKNIADNCFEEIE
jgi:hypothetical protein